MVLIKARPDAVPTRTDGRTDRQTDRQTDGQEPFSQYPAVAGNCDSICALTAYMLSRAIIKERAKLFNILSLKIFKCFGESLDETLLFVRKTLLSKMSGGRKREIGISFRSRSSVWGSAESQYGTIYYRNITLALPKTC